MHSAAEVGGPRRVLSQSAGVEAHLATLFEAVADAIPDRAALIHGSKRRTWSAFDDGAALVASAPVAAGLTTQSKVGLYLFNSAEYLEAQLGVLKMRGVPVNVNYRYRDQELAYLLTNSDAEALVFYSSLADTAGASPPISGR